MYLCYQNNVHLLFLPPHTSHVLQPLDQSVFGPLKTAYKKELGLRPQWDCSTVVGKRTFILCYGKARHAALTTKNIISGWRYTGLWPVNMGRPLISPLLLENTITPANVNASEIWAKTTSAVPWSTPRKREELRESFSLFSKLEGDVSTRRLLFRKVEKAWDERAY
ncbi:transposase [Colletotrichum musicola]|uniref:Transposase n=1 Tax=Colletotrichum musicola TaxID=2175873 RepID=A0A8H6KG64_9PEZI|nr:transposase [Colletotrichum musicola]